MARKKRTKIVNASKCSYRGIQFQSKLELFAYKSLKKDKLKVDYEKHTFTILEGATYSQECYEGTKVKLYNKGSKIRPITYTRDFVDPDGIWIMETKGHANESFPLRWKLFNNYLINTNSKATLFLPRNRKQVTEAVEIIKTL